GAGPGARGPAPDGAGVAGLRATHPQPPFPARCRERPVWRSEGHTPDNLGTPSVAFPTGWASVVFRGWDRDREEERDRRRPLTPPPPPPPGGGGGRKRGERAPGIRVVVELKDSV